MNRTNNYFRIGVFVLAAVGLLLVAVFYLGARALFEPVWIMETYFDSSVQGLDVGSPVKYLGVSIGTVKSLGFVQGLYKTDKPYVLIRMGIEPGRLARELRRMGLSETTLEQEVQQMVAEGFRLQLANQGITGTCYLEAKFVDAATHPSMDIDWTPQVPYIPAIASTIQRLGNTIEDLLLNLQKVDYAAIGQNAGALLANINIVVTNQLAPLLVSLNRAAKDMPAEFQGMARNLNQTMDRDFKPVLDNLKSATASLAPLIDELAQTVNNANRWTSEKRASLDAAVDNVQAISANLEAVSDTLREYPALLLFGDPPPPVNLDPP